MLNVERVLRNKGMTQGDLAKKLGVSTQAVNSVVCGRSVASDRLLARYAEALGVEKEELYDDFFYEQGEEDFSAQCRAGGQDD